MKKDRVSRDALTCFVYHILVSEYPAVESVKPAPDSGFDIYEVPLSTDPILNVTLPTPQLILPRQPCSAPAR
jgi:hypothetical protein